MTRLLSNRDFLSCKQTLISSYVLWHYREDFEVRLLHHLVHDYDLIAEYLSSWVKVCEAGPGGNFLRR